MKRILAVLTFVLTLAFLATPALASPNYEPPAVADDSSTAKLRIADVAAPILNPGQDLVVTVEVTNGRGSTSCVRLRPARPVVRNFRYLDLSLDEGCPQLSWVATLPMDRTVAPGATFTTQLIFFARRYQLAYRVFQLGSAGHRDRGYRYRAAARFDRTMVVAAPSAEILRYPATAVVAMSDAVTKRAHINTLPEHGDPPSPAAETQQVTEWDMAGVSLLVDRSLAGQTKHATQLPLPTYDADIAALAALGLEAKARQLGADAVYLPQGSPNETAIEFAQKARHEGTRSRILSYHRPANLTYTVPSPRTVATRYWPRTPPCLKHWQAACLCKDQGGGHA